ncbi:MAG: adenosine deaminase [Verrucomicrobiales bacterium]|jgi:adenosine deaminase
MNVDDALRKMPKTELHVHLEGAVDVNTFAELAKKHHVDLPAHDDPAELYQYDSLVDFLTMYTAVSHAVRDQSDFQRVTYECLQRCSNSGARYVELFFSPESHLEIGVAYPTMLAGVLQGMTDAQADFGLLSNLVPAINRELGGSRAVEFVQMVQDLRDDRVIGVGLDFNEDGFPPENYVEAFRLAANYGLHRTSHAGEVGPAANVRGSIELLDSERIDHGYNIVDDASIVAACVESQIGFTVCPTTTTYTSAFRDLAAPDHAIRQMANAGLNLNINSDDPAMFNSDLADEFSIVHHTMGFTLPEIKQFALNGIDAAWIDDSTKAQWRIEWSAEIDSLFSDVS